jgi:two-component system chemotaxis sensor kinase CheA
MDDLLREFLIETNESLDLVDAQLVRFEQEPNNAQILDNIFRLVHTIKGTCGFLALPRLEALAHAAEALMSKFRSGSPVSSEAVTLILATLDRIKDLLDELEQNQREQDGSDRDLIGALEHLAGAEPHSPVADATPSMLGAGNEQDSEHSPDGRVARQTIRVSVSTLEHLMTMVSELVLTRNQLLELMRRHEDSEFKAPLQRLSSVTAELQEGVMRTRMQPIHTAWQKLPRVVRDLATELGKEIEIEMHGSETELDRQVLELIKDPLTHMVRNSADHGIETPQERRSAGKPKQGTIRLTAYHEGGYIIIGITDDGRGLDTEKIKATALANGLATEAEIEKMAEAHIHRFIFAPGFSTAAKVTSISGRGVGMDVVRTNIEQIGGTVDVTSIKGKGLSFTVKIPLTLAIISALIVESAGERFAIPQRSVVELVHARAGSEHRIEHIKDAPVLRLRNKLLPLVQLGKLLDLASGEVDLENAFIAVIQVGEPFGIVVDGVVHTEEIVVKPLSTKLRHIALFSGTTILGDGSVILILDPNGIARAIGTAVTSYEAVEKPAHEAGRVDDLTSLLVFRAGAAEPKAVPLSLVTRLEEVDSRKIELSNGRHMVQYRGQLMPLVPINDEVRIKSDGAQPLVVFSDSGRSMGLVVDEIVDIVEDRLDIAVASDRPGVLGSALIKGRATEIIDVGHFLPIAYDDWFRRKEMGSAAQSSVLLVDDSPFFLNLLAPVLRAAGYDVVTVGGAPEALALLRSGRRFDVLLTDLDMPGMSGFDLAEAVRSDAQTSDLPIIALSSMTEPGTDERGRRAGFRDHVAKSDRQGLIAALKAQSQVSRAA